MMSSYQNENSKLLWMIIGGISIVVVLIFAVQWFLSQKNHEATVSKGFMAEAIKYAHEHDVSVNVVINIPTETSYQYSDIEIKALEADIFEAQALGADSIEFLALNEDGSFDTSFGDSGIRKIAFGDLGSDGGAVGLQSDGKIIIAGANASSTGRDVLVARLQSDGDLDTTFGASGIFSTSVTV